jgi:ATP-dependent RNA helicase DDX54/DBP10
MLAALCRFRDLTNSCCPILVPLLANVINYDMPSQPKIFVHRVGRTARAGRKGWSYNLVRDSDVPYLIDLQLFLGKPLVFDGKTAGEPNYAQDVIVGSFVQDELEPMVELVNNLHGTEEDLVNLQAVARKGGKNYLGNLLDQLLTLQKNNTSVPGTVAAPRA